MGGCVHCGRPTWIGHKPGCPWWVLNGGKDEDDGARDEAVKAAVAVNTGER